MGFYADQVLPRGIDWVMGGEGFSRLRPRATAGLAGEVLELGFGSGLNLPHYPPEVTRLVAVDPATVGRRLARRRLAASPLPVDFVDLVDGRPDLAPGSVDAILSTWTLCTIPDVARVLADLRGVLRPGGRLHFLEHGLSPDPGVARWQRRLNGLQQLLCGGCQLVIPMDRMLGEAGWEVTELEHPEMSGPRFASYLYAGRARPA